MGLSNQLSDYAERALADGDGAQPMIYPDYALWPLPPLSVWDVLHVALLVALVVLQIWILWRYWK